ncbi:MAG: hypothetical protein PWR13_1070 [Archaeoglobi archaeon]|nr:hypothetical protein [Archaeoglobi archaeon]
MEFYVLDSQTEQILQKVKDLIDLRFSQSVVEVVKPEIVVSVKAREDKPEERTPVEILMDSVKRFSDFDPEIALLTALASVVAFSGLVLNNAVIIIGAMLLSPLLGPIHGFTIFLSAGKIKQALKCLRNLIFNLFASLAVSALVALIIFHPAVITAEIALRTESNPYYTIMAIALGFASLLSISKGVAESVAGVAVAASIIPPAVVAGMLLWSYPLLAFRAFVVMLENVVGLLFGGIIAVQLLEVKPTKYYERKIAAQYIFRSVVALVALIILLILLSGV